MEIVQEKAENSIQRSDSSVRKPEVGVTRTKIGFVEGQKWTLRSILS